MGMELTYASNLVMSLRKIRRLEGGVSSAPITFWLPDIAYSDRFSKRKFVSPRSRARKIQTILAMPKQRSSRNLV